MSPTDAPRPVPMTQKIDAADALDLIALVLADRTHPSRSGTGGECPLPYTDDHCLVGRVLQQAGVPTNALDRIEGVTIRDLWREGRLPLSMTFGAVLVLHRAQIVADRGLPWRNAYRESWAAAVRLVRLVAGDQAAADNQMTLGAVQRIQDSLVPPTTRTGCRHRFVPSERLR